MLMLIVSFCCWVWFADLLCLFSYLYCADVCSIMLVNLYLIGVCCDLLVWGILFGFALRLLDCGSYVLASSCLFVSWWLVVV